MKSFAVVPLCFLMSCGAVGPDYVTPTIDLPSRFAGGGAESIPNAPQTVWWSQLNDPLLSELIAWGIAQNLNVQIALERIEESQAGLRASGASLTNGSLTAEVTTGESEGIAADTRAYRLNAGLVLDIFGRNAREVEQAAATLDATRADLGTARLAFLTELVDNYVQARYYQEAATILRQTVQSRSRTLQAVENRLEVGDATIIEVQRARADLASAKARLPLQLANYEASVFRIATLLAEPSASLQRQMGQGRAIPRPIGGKSAGVPADLFRSRPDVQAAERNFASATAAIGVSEAQLYPSITLNGSIGTGDTDQWSFGPQVDLALFNRGTLLANRNAAISRARQAELQWRQAVLKASEETEAAIALLRGWRQQLAAQQDASEAIGAVAELSLTSYETGEIPLAELLDVERQFADARLSTADARRNATLSWVRLQIATGRGWKTQSSSELMRRTLSR